MKPGDIVILGDKRVAIAISDEAALLLGIRPKRFAVRSSAPTYRPKAKTSIANRVATIAAVYEARCGLWERICRWLDFFLSWVLVRDTRVFRRLAGSMRPVLALASVAAVFDEVLGWRFANRVPRSCRAKDVVRDIEATHPHRWERVQ